MNKRDIIIGLLIAVVIGMALSPFASSFPDGLEWVAEKMGFIVKGEVAPVVKSPVPDYAFPFVNEKSVWATSLSGLLGVLLVFLAAVAIGKLLIPKK